jgi:SNF2 family DNA or RNA helicase
MMSNNTEAQKRAIAKLGRLKVGALFMATGTGKTKTALDLIASKSHKIDYVLWICPYSLKNEIEAERQKWHPELNLDVIGCESIGSSDRIYLELIKKTEGQRTFIVVDESLKIKNRHAKRTDRIIKLGEQAKYKLILNGTPISKNYCDIWAQMQFLSPKILSMSYNQFYNTYCAYYTRGRYKGRIKNFVNIPHLIDKISPYVFEASLDIETRKQYHVKCYHTPMDSYKNYKDEIFDQYFNEERDDLNFNAFAMKLQKFYTSHSDRTEKMNELIQEINDQVIIFVRFIASIPEGAHKITGDEKAKERKEILGAFKRKEFNVLYITYGCGSFGLNLQFCKNMIFAEHTWDYAVREQAEARIYRMGQGEEVNYYDMICGGVGLEDLIFRCISRKGNMLDTVKREIQKHNGGAKEFVKNL